MAGAVASSATVAQVERAIRGNRRDLFGRLFQAILILMLGSAAVTGVPTLMDRGMSFFTDGNSTISAHAGIAQALVGSLLLMAIVAVVALPIGIGAAIYIEEYARDTRVTRFINANIRNLAGVPSIVYGLLGLAIFVDALRHVATGIRSTGSLISGGLTLAVLVLPIVIITTAEALRAVPTGIREAAYGVGATRWEVIRSHVLPYSAPGILTGVVLTLARAFGETAPLILVGGVKGYFSTGGAGLGEKIFGDKAYTALPLLIYDWSGRPEHAFKDLAAAAIVVMMVVLLLVNGVAIVMRNRYERKW